MARIVESTRSGQILELNGYRYTKNRSAQDKNKIYWRCILRQSCNGSLTTNYNTQNGIIIGRGNKHLHEPDTVEVQVQEVVRGIKRRARELPNAPPSSIYRDEIATVSNNEELISNLPQRQDIIRTINRVQNRNRPLHPQSLAELDIQSPYNVTLTGETFLQYDSGQDDPNRFVMFYTRSCLEKLCASRMILCDGTFKTVPGMFCQMYSIHGIFSSYTFPMIYALASRKDEVFYRAMLDRLKTHAVELQLTLNPQYISSDFELPFLNAAKFLFPNASLHGCLFHFTQSVWRNAVNKGLKVAFNTIPEVRKTIQCVLALPFVPLDDIEEVFDLIVINSPQPDDVHNVPEDITENLADLLNYVDRTYVKGVAARGRRRAVQPRFPPKLWNVYQLTLTKQQRSTNAVEGWHSRFQRIIVQHHSGIWRFIEHLKKDQNENQRS